MNGPRINPSRQYGERFGATARQRAEYRMPQFFKRLFKFPQMDFETAVWEMTHLIIAPKKVFKSIYYQKQTRNTWHRPDPAFAYLLSFFLLLTSFAWSLAYTPTLFKIITLAFMFVFVHFVLGSVLLSLASYFFIGRFLTRGIPGLPGRRRQAGLFNHTTPSTSASGPGGGQEQLEFGYCFDVTIRAFFPVYVLLYIVQYVLMPAIDHTNRASVFVANILYLLAGVYWSLITFLGYNSLPFLHHTQLLLAPIPAWLVGWIICTVLGVNLEKGGVRWLFTGIHI